MTENKGVTGPVEKSPLEERGRASRPGRQRGEQNSPYPLAGGEGESLDSPPSHTSSHA